MNKYNIRIFNNSTLNDEILFYNFYLKKHIETKKEARKLKLNENTIEKKASFSMKYNYFSKKYEDFLNTDKLVETSIPIIYDLIGAFSNEDPRYDLKSYYENFSIDKNLPNYNKNKIYFKSSFNFANNNHYKNYVPICSEITIQNTKNIEYGFYDMLNKYNKLDELLKIYSYTNLPKNGNFILTNEQLTRLSNNDILFLSNFYSIMNKYTSHLSSTQLNFKILPITHHEILGYKISKHKGKNFLDPIQEWYIPNKDTEFSSFIDTQLKYNTNYYYKISYLVCFVATKYNVKTNKKEPIFMIKEVLSTDYENRILDRPPMPPDFSFVPSIGVDNKIKILFQHSYGNFLLKPISILNKENIECTRLLEAQDRSPTDKLYFDTGQTPKRFQILRLQTKPNKYSDFKFADVTTLQEDLSSFEDIIKPNVTYYYTFRSIDYHNHFSNPTKIFSLNIINDNGMIYPIIENYEFDEEKLDKLEPDLKFKRFLGISPRVNHLIYEDELNQNLQNLSKDVIIDRLKVGNISPSIWNKKFKIRITSLSSGKKIDINVDFNKLKKKN